MEWILPLAGPSNARARVRSHEKLQKTYRTEITLVFKVARCAGLGFRAPRPMIFEAVSKTVGLLTAFGTGIAVPPP